MPRFGMARHTPNSFTHDQQLVVEHTDTSLQPPSSTAVAAAAIIQVSPSASSSSSPAETAIRRLTTARRMEATPPRSQRHHHTRQYLGGVQSAAAVGAEGGRVGAVKPSRRQPSRHEQHASSTAGTSTGWSTSPVVDVHHYVHRDHHHETQPPLAQQARVTSPIGVTSPLPYGDRPKSDKS